MSRRGFCQACAGARGKRIYHTCGKYDNKFTQTVSLDSAQELTDDWQPYTGSYRKEIYAIRLKDGSEYDWAWPNAGMFCLEKGKDVPLSEVTHVKKGRNPFR